MRSNPRTGAWMHAAPVVIVALALHGSMAMDIPPAYTLTPRGVLLAAPTPATHGAGGGASTSSSSSHTDVNTTTAAPVPSVSVEVGAEGVFRLGVSFQGDASDAIPSPTLDASRTLPPFDVVTRLGMTGIRTSFGTLVANTTGAWVILDGADNVLASAGNAMLATEENGTVSYDVSNLTGTGVNNGGNAPCLGNGFFAPPYIWDAGAQLFAYAVSPWEYDPDAIHCYPASFKSFTSLSTNPHASVVTPTPSPSTISAVSAVNKETCTPTKSNTDVTRFQRSTAAPNGVKNTTLASCCGACDNATDCIAWVRTADGKPDGSGMNCWLFSHVCGTTSRNDRTFGGSLTPPSGCSGPPPGPPGPAPVGPGWSGRGRRMDWYLAPAKTGYSYLGALYNLTGAPAVPPRYGMAFMATYWGYKSMQQVEGYMHQFRNGSYPIDSFIMDYDWFGPQPCGAKGAQGGYNCGDFGYRGAFWANQTFVQPDGSSVVTHTAADVLKHFHAPPLSMRFGGIRKPRSYSNVNLSNESGWLLEAGSNVGAGGNNWNYSVADMREWYTKNHLHFLDDGVDFWWNDEGETQFFTYLYWNIAQQAQWAASKPNQRHFTINRAFQPGMQRFPAITWTGDGQDCSHVNILKFQMFGQLYSACDMTSPDATVLVRQYQNAVFLPIMRVHQMHGTPRFPFLWGGEEHQEAFRQALNTRYQFLPYLYSLAHRAHRENLPIIAPAAYEYGLGGDANSPLMSQIMVGGDLIPADVSTSHKTDGENASSVSLPPGDWYLLNTTTTTPGNQTITATLGLNEFPVYVRPGAILPLQQAVVQTSAEIGGQLVVHVYAGRSNTITMVEDDGATLDYLTGYTGATKTTVWTWDDSAKTLSWSASGGFSGDANTYTTVQAVLFTPSSSKTSAAVPLSASGSIPF
eukprot:m.83348 g.83348  ORF g.83348 m.83348 type:complete len:913 (-) comp9532_c0_seq2:3272-6010(-)